MNKGIDKALSEHGYREMIATEENIGYRIYYDMMKSLVNAVIFVEAGRYSDDFLGKFKESMIRSMEGIGKETHFFVVVLVDSSKETYVEDFAVAKQVCSDNVFSWIYDESAKQLIVYESQAEDFYGLREIIENAPEEVEEETGASPKEKKATLRKRLARIPKATSMLVFINIVVFLICTFTGDLLYNKGAVGIKFLTDYTQYYRIVSSMFLHADISHIFGNMVLLYFVGEMVEDKVGPVRFTIIYLLSGIWGSVASFLHEMFSHEYIMAVGASGAVFGILGCLLALVIFRVIRGKAISLWRILFVIAVSLFDGFHAANVANWAHIGGLVSGFIMGVVYCLAFVQKMKKGRANED